MGRIDAHRKGGQVESAVPSSGLSWGRRKRNATGLEETEQAKATAWQVEAQRYVILMKSVKVANRRCNSRGQARAWLSDL